MIKDGKLRCVYCDSDHVSTQPRTKQAADGLTEVDTLVICNDCGATDSR